HQRFDESRDTDAEDAGAVVVDEDGDLHAGRRGSEADDRTRLAAIFDDEVAGPEIGERGAVCVERGDVDLPRLPLSRRDDRRGAHQPHDANDLHGRPPAGILHECWLTGFVLTPGTAWKSVPIPPTCSTRSSKSRRSIS